jgi:hypothetical protein
VRQHPKWTTKLLTIEQFDQLETSSPIGAECHMGVHTIKFADGSTASIFRDIVNELKKIDTVLETIYEDANVMLRHSIILGTNELVTIEGNINGNPPAHTEVTSTLHRFIPLEGMDQVLPSFVSETFTFKNSLLSPERLFGQTFANHIKEGSFFIKTPNRGWYDYKYDSFPRYYSRCKSC